MLTKEELIAIGRLVTLGGKSPHTGDDGIIAAAQALGWLQREYACLESEERKIQEQRYASKDTPPDSQSGA
jgi:hypothetical protein